ncbi:hypothetical protein BV20DRAFT_937525 [Pilatotrama ljubarskyi]|nr:hypothetical protein BV20DRAFT_937525 [Pilatotrama ljubarskyi]
MDGLSDGVDPDADKFGIQVQAPTLLHGSESSCSTITLVFPLKVFRAKDFKVIAVQPVWDDEAILIALKRAYDELRGWRRRYFGLMDVGHLTLVRADHSFIYPQRIGSSWLSPPKNMRICYLLRNASHLRGQRQIVTALTRRLDVGVEFVERWKTTRLLAVCAASSYAVMAVWAARTGDWATGSQMGQFHLSLFQLLFIALYWSHAHQF